jgi:hypothetical protein
MTFKESAVEFLSAYDINELYVAPFISERRLQNAFKEHGVAVGERIFAIIDCTIMGASVGGSASKGMSITEKGIYWKNGWTVATVKSHLSWTELAASADRMEIKSSNVRFGPRVEFFPLGMKPAKVIELLKGLLRIWAKECSSLAPPGSCAGSDLSAKHSVNPRGGSTTQETTQNEDNALPPLAHELIEQAIDAADDDDVVLALHRFRKVRADAGKHILDDDIASEVTKLLNDEIRAIVRAYHASLRTIERSAAPAVHRMASEAIDRLTTRLKELITQQARRHFDELDKAGRYVQSRYPVSGDDPFS